MTDFHSLISNKTFVFTGKLAHSTRKKAKNEVLVRGGNCNNCVTTNTNYVMVGLETFDQFINGTKNTKFKKTEKCLEKGYPINIINEQEFINLLG
jgi:DNA polymerase III subunit epsilon